MSEMWLRFIFYYGGKEAMTTITQPQALKLLRDAIKNVVWFDWSDNDADAVDSMDALVDAFAATAPDQVAPAAPDGWQLVPIEPTKEMLYSLVIKEWPEDWSAGKDAQMRLGLDVIPPKTEYECAYGEYKRLLAAAPGAGK
jgi:hypothetical protein